MDDLVPGLEGLLFPSVAGVAVVSIDVDVESVNAGAAIRGLVGLSALLPRLVTRMRGDHGLRSQRGGPRHG
ncbi:hypothetical protein [Streptomyces sp. 1331.2]|uniref:hypothetical protein n=1 Tax=Streptomyces sp. 1331.2 TaxID=1938835 RepID=UPI00117C55DD|nr:hypothetical protein [Streptomyces sp. 1331.2]